MSNQRNKNRVKNYVSANGLEITKSTYEYFSGSLRVKETDEGAFILTGMIKLPYLKPNDKEGQLKTAERPGLGKNEEVPAILAPLGMSKDDAITADIETEGLFQEVRNVIAFYKSDLTAVAGIIQVLEVDDVNDLGTMPAMRGRFIYGQTKVEVEIVGFLNMNSDGEEYFRLAPAAGAELFSGKRVAKFSRRKASGTGGDEPGQMDAWATAKALREELNAKPAKPISDEIDIEDAID